MTCDQTPKIPHYRVRHPIEDCPFAYTGDLAGYLAAVVDAAVAGGERIGIGWDRPLNFRELGRIGGELLGREMEVFAVPPAGRPAPGP